ncbi:hypothetical protein [Martelella limonii]|uniref:hypothetical protein n=1 Tax=Martelella limonii TaxID=1647649 RepID=UPI00157FC1D4|nr:hypothetical protein [Martelella limonii]
MTHGVLLIYLNGPRTADALFWRGRPARSYTSLADKIQSLAGNVTGFDMQARDQAGDQVARVYPDLLFF